MYEIPWIGIAAVLALFIVLTFMYLKIYEKRRKKKNQRGALDLTQLVVTEKKHTDKNIKLF